MKTISISVITLPLLWALVIAHDTQSPRSHSITRGTHIPTVSSTATCKSRTINYITDTLPQQCLASTRRPPDQKSVPHQQPDQGSSVAESEGVPQRSSGDTADQLPLTTPSPSIVRSDLLPTSTTPTPTPTPTSIPTASNAPSGGDAPSSTSVNPGSKSVETDMDSPLDNANFLSFEEWKKQNLAKSGQDPSEAGPRSRKVSGSQDQTGLEVLGEDAEINIDFSGFGAAQHAAEELIQSSSLHPSPPHSDLVQPPATPRSSGNPRALTLARSKDAGRTCKERTNYASLDCAATVLKSNKECKSASSVLIENKDSYMLNVCNAPNKHLIVEMCDDILIDTVVLANYEFFSSIFRTFRVSASDRYPPKNDNWQQLGIFEARNTRQVQAFLVEQPLIWARFVKIDFLSHYGNEYYCPVSLLRIHGTTMLEEFKHQDELPRANEPGPIDDSASEVGTIAQEAPMSSVTADQRATLVNTAASSTETHSQNLNSGSATDQCMRAQHPDLIPLIWTSCTIPSISDHPQSASKIPVSAVSSVTLTATSRVQLPEDSTGSTRTIENEAMHSAPSDERVDQSSHTPTTTPPRRPNGDVPTLARDRIATSISAQPPPAMPSTQESFYKSMHKRLQMLESNATLSLQYIEEQSRILRDAFSKVERRQVNKTENFLRELNRTVLAELAGFRTQYDHLWQSTVIELETHREQYQRELLAVSSRLNIVAEELLFQKRMVVIQSTLLILCLGLIVFARVGTSGLTLEVPLLQQVLSKSSSYAQHRYTSSGYNVPDLGSPTSASPPPHDAPSPASWRHSWSNAWSRGGPPSPEAEPSSGEVDSGSAVGMKMTFQPPTPLSSEKRQSETDRDQWRPATAAASIGHTLLNDRLDEAGTTGPEHHALPNPYRHRLLESQSGPSTPTGTREPTKSIVDGV